MKKLKVSDSNQYENIGIDTQYGFAHIVTSECFTIQCCLMLRKDQKGYKKQIDKKDCGFDDGICGDVNIEAVEKYGKETCIKFLFSVMRKNGVKII